MHADEIAERIRNHLADSPAIPTAAAGGSSSNGSKKGWRARLKKLERSLKKRLKWVAEAVSKPFRGLRNAWFQRVLRAQELQTRAIEAQTAILYEVNARLQQHNDSQQAHEEEIRSLYAAVRDQHLELLEVLQSERAAESPATIPFVKQRGERDAA